MWRSWERAARVKSTLLNIMAALDKPTEGTVLLDGKPLSSIKDKEYRTVSARQSWICFSGI